MAAPAPQLQEFLVPSRTPPSGSTLRRTVAIHSAPALLALSRVPRWVPAIALAVVLVTGLATGGVLGAVCLGVLALMLLWLGYLSWPALTGPARLLRVATLAVLVYAAAASLWP